MKKSSLTLRLLWALALLLVAAFATAQPSGKLLSWNLSALASLPVFHEDRQADGKVEQLGAVAEAVAAASYGRPRSPREWSALLLTIGYHESTFSLRIHRGECNLQKRECDAAKVKGQGLVARARSSWQLHSNGFTAPFWDKLHGVENTEVQARVAADALERGYWTCAKSGVPWLQATINGYAGRRCSDSSWPGLQQRIATFNRLSRTPQPAAGGAS